MLQNAYLVAKIDADTAENDRNFAEILPKIGNYPTGPLPASAGSLELWDLIMQLNKRAGANGCGFHQIVEDRIVGLKVRGVYENPAASVPRMLCVCHTSGDRKSLVTRSRGLGVL